MKDQRGSGTPNGLEVGFLTGAAGARRTVVLAGLLVLIGYGPALKAPMNSDVAWLLYVAERWMGGAELYVDLVETNPPLVVWLYAPAVWLGRLLPLSTYAAFLVWIGVVLTGSLALAARLLRRLEAEREPAARRVLLLLFVLGLFVLAGRSLGQKDHLVVALTLPYLLAVVARSRGEAVPRGPARLAGALAAVGVCLKPHFLLLPAALETTRHLARGAPGRWWRSETRVLAAGVVLYPLVVLVATPGYVAVVERFGTLYTRHVQLGLSELASQPASLLVAAGWVAYGLVDEPPERAALTRAFLVAGTAMLLAAALQLKGWSYHFLPALVLGTWAVGMTALPSPSQQGKLARLGRGVAGGLLAALVASALWSVGSIATERSTEEVRLERLTGLLSSCGADDVLAVLSPRVGSAFPLVNRTGMRWGLRHHSQWALTVSASAARADGPGGGDVGHARESAAWNTMRQETLADLGGRPPAWLLVDDRAADLALGPAGADLLALYREESEFRELLADYESAGSLAGYRLRRRAGSGDGPDPCRGGRVRR